VLSSDGANWLEGQETGRDEPIMIDAGQRGA
jgi:hypothetical protein